MKVVEAIMSIDDTNLRIHERLVELAEPKYQEFSNRLLPEVTNLLGVRLPKLRVIARDLAKKDWKDYLENARDTSFEEIMLQGMVIGYIKEPLELLLPYIERFVPKISNWSVCDSFCSGLKITNKEPELMWGFLHQYLYSDKEFCVRFSVVMMLNYYVEEKFIEEVFSIFEKIKQTGYYTQMAIAWAISVYYMKFPLRTTIFLEKNQLDSFTHNKAIQKICESRVIQTEDKEKVKTLYRDR